MGEKPVIEINDLAVSYGSYEAVRDITLSVAPGELYALLGTNGAGKTSTLETIEGHRKPSRGTVRVFGLDPTDRRRVRPRVGIMLQESGFAPDLTVSETVRLIGRLTRRSDDLDRVLAVADLTAKRTTKVAQLSGGEKRRLDFATAIFGSPDLIFLDEPTTALDIHARDALWAAVTQMRHGGTTIVLTTHYLEEAQQYADRIGVMHRGQLRMEGTVTELTQMLPATITFRLPPGTATPRGAVRRDSAGESAWVIETQDLQRDLHLLLNWAAERSIAFDDLAAGPTSLDDVFRALND
ncbi:ABC transporter ATP-binding protein [Corynebacterium timonense]|uniref:ABC-2 type transport system ATP-binding protein n=1 Tax=Corynebacterium timonense TaxID=441500 RepID=A0A1H1U649_9CORY|nr:ABC transporter ATP-binding protein [Corynebacterium timonense]SDS67980.1 ABC-2 type transport system ATP-binding protein [Corynebacterium timonense]